MCRSVDPLRGAGSLSGWGLALRALLPAVMPVHHWCLILAIEIIYYWERSAAGAGTRL